MYNQRETADTRRLRSATTGRRRFHLRWLPRSQVEPGGQRNLRRGAWPPKAENLAVLDPCSAGPAGPIDRSRSLPTANDGQLNCEPQPPAYAPTRLDLSGRRPRWVGAEAIAYARRYEGPAGGLSAMAKSAGRSNPAAESRRFECAGYCAGANKWLKTFVFARGEGCLTTPDAARKCHSAFLSRSPMERM
jgi:hypothetical protein